MNEILKNIKDRRSLRMPFDAERSIAKQDLKQILEAARWTPTAHNMQNFEIIVVDDKKILKAIFSIKRTISETFVRENYLQLSFSEEELLKKKTGILGTMFPPSWRKSDFSLKNFSKKEIESMQGFYPTGPLLLVILYDPSKRAPASEGDFLGIISLGCVMENMWLVANSLGIGFHILSSLSSEPVVKEVKKILNIPKNLDVAFTCRLGYPKNRPTKYLRVRRDIEDFIHNNRY
jgi:nitroreductase